jgi:Tocopherol cyclase
MEGYYWRFGGGDWSVAVIAGVCRAPDGTWAMITLAAAPGGFARTAVAPAARHGSGIDAGGLLVGGLDGLRVMLGEDARLDVSLRERRDWPRRGWGALGPAHAVPGLGQYWSPHLLGASVSGAAVVGSRELPLDGTLAYAEKNWGAAFARHWWWGQAWLESDSGVAFAGGRLPVGAPTAVVAWSPAGLVRLAPPFARTVAGAGAGVWHVRAASARWTVELEGEAAEPPLRLPVPIPAERRLEPRSEHHLRGRVRVVVRRGRRVWLRGESSLAGLEEGRPRRGPGELRG